MRHSETYEPPEVVVSAVVNEIKGVQASEERVREVVRSWVKHEVRRLLHWTEREFLERCGDAMPTDRKSG